MDEQYIELAETIAYRVNVKLYFNNEDFKSLCDTYTGTLKFLELSYPEVKDKFKKLEKFVKEKLIHDMLRELFPVMHPYGKCPFFYLNEKYILRETEMEMLIENITARIPKENRAIFRRHVTSFKRISRFYEKHISKYTDRFIDACYKYYC